MKRVDISSITQQQCEEILKVEVVKDHLDTAIDCNRSQIGLGN